MRPIATAQDALRYPLNQILGKEAQVRILRVLSEAGEQPLGAAQIARRACLSAPGARTALAPLALTGFVIRTGGKRDSRYALNRDVPLVEALVELFRVESGQRERLVSKLRSVANQVSPLAISLWLEPPSQLGEALVVGVLHDTRVLSRYLRELRSLITPVEQEFEMTIEIRGFTRADLPVMLPDEWVLLGGVPPTLDSDRSGKPPTHKDYDRRSARMAEAVAGLLRSDPTLIERAREYVGRLLDRDQGMATPDLEEWNQVLQSYSLPRLLRFLTAESPRAVRLRQSSPLIAVLTPRERKLVAANLET